MSKYKIPIQYLGAFKAGHRPQMREYIDDDLSWELLNRIIKSNYTDKEAMEQLAYITKFNNEYYKKVGLNQPDALHQSEQQKKDCYNRGNANSRDLMALKRKERVPMEGTETQDSNSETLNLGSIHNKPIGNEDHEEVIIEIIDNINEINKKKSKKKPKSST